MQMFYIHINGMNWPDAHMCYGGRRFYVQPKIKQKKQNKAEKVSDKQLQKQSIWKASLINSLMTMQVIRGRKWKPIQCEANMTDWRKEQTDFRSLTLQLGQKRLRVFVTKQRPLVKVGWSPVLGEKNQPDR